MASPPFDAAQGSSSGCSAARISQTWQQALTRADDDASDRRDLHTHLPELLDQVIAACLAAPFDPVSAQAIGAALAELCVSRPEALGATQTVLAQELIAGVPEAGLAALQPRVAALLGALATGFARQMRLWTPPPITVTFRPHVDTTDYRVLIEHIPAITYIAAFDETSSTVYTSPQIASILGFSQAEWMADHRRWLTQIHPGDRARVLAELERIHDGGLPRPCEYRMLTRDRRVVRACAAEADRAVPVPGGAGSAPQCDQPCACAAGDAAHAAIDGAGAGDGVAGYGCKDEDTEKDGEGQYYTTMFVARLQFIHFKPRSVRY